MGTVLPFPEHKPFDPATCDAMGAAFESAWQRLLAAGTDLDHRFHESGWMRPGFKLSL
jgi:hypothetical protein